MNDYQKNVESLNKMFDRLNERYFGGILERPTITIQVDKRAYGYFTVSKVWTGAKDSQTHEINVAPNYKRNKYDLVGTLLHEMVHLYATMQGVKDSSRQGRYHNRTFEKLASERGLIVDYGGDVIGWGITRPNDKLIEFIDSTKIEFRNCFRYVEEKERKEPKPRQKKYKFKCPTCELVVETTAEATAVQLECTLCHQLLRLM